MGRDPSRDRNVFSALSLRARRSKKEEDLFKGLLGVFNGLFTPAEIKRGLEGTDIEALSFAFFKQLSIKTKRAWTRLVTSSWERGEWGLDPRLGEDQDIQDEEEAGNLLICRDHPLDKYRVVGVCIDGLGAIASKKAEHEVTVQ